MAPLGLWRRGSRALFDHQLFFAQIFSLAVEMCLNLKTQNDLLVIRVELWRISDSTCQPLLESGNSGGQTGPYSLGQGCKARRSPGNRRGDGLGCGRNPSLEKVELPNRSSDEVRPVKRLFQMKLRACSRGRNRRQSLHTRGCRSKERGWFLQHNSGQSIDWRADGWFSCSCWAASSAVFSNGISGGCQVFGLLPHPSPPQGSETQFGW